MNRSAFPILVAAVGGATAMTVGLAMAQGRFDRDAAPAAQIRVFEGVSDRGTFQEALDRAIGDAQRSLPGADRMVRYKVRDITGEAGGIRGGNRLRVTIEVPDEDAGPGRPDDRDFRPERPERPDDRDEAGDTSAVLRESLRPQLRLAADEIERGDSANFELTVRNNSDRTVRVPFNTGQQYNFEVWRDNRLVWSWAQGRAFTQSLTSVTLRPDQTVTYSVRWNGLNNAGERVSPGEYQVRGYLPTGIRDFRIGDSAILTVR